MLIWRRYDCLVKERWSGLPSERRQPPTFKTRWQVRIDVSPYWPLDDATIVRVLEKWIPLVQDGTWKVWPGGIKGKLEKFMKRETPPDHRVGKVTRLSQLAPALVMMD